MPVATGLVNAPMSSPRQVVVVDVEIEELVELVLTEVELLVEEVERLVLELVELVLVD